MLSAEHKQIGITFNPSKSEAVSFCRKAVNSRDRVEEFFDEYVVLSDSIVERARKAIGLYHQQKNKCNRQVRFRLYNALFVPVFF